MRLHNILAAALASATFAAAASAAIPISVLYESEAPGMQATTATLSVGGVETFDTRALGGSTSFTTSFGSGGAITGSYTGVQIINADQYGGAGGSGQYAVTFSNTGYSLDLASTVPGGVNYFGYWLSALDHGNQVSFFSRGKLLFVFNPQDVINAVNAGANPGAYYGNPNNPYQGANRGEPYIFLNFFADRGSFDKIIFAENPQSGGYESDNHTIGRFLTKGTGTAVPLLLSAGGAVPEPATWAMLVAGMGLVGATMRRRRGTAVVAA